MPGCWVGETIRYRGSRSELTTCMIIANEKPIRIIGYQASSMMHEFVNEIGKTHSYEIIEPDVFLQSQDKTNFQYICTDWIDRSKKFEVIQMLDQQNLDLISVVHDTAILGHNPDPVIGPGTFIHAFCHIGLGSKIGRHCIISPYSQIGHYSAVGNACVLRPGVMIIDKSTVGNFCVFNARSLVAGRSTVGDGIELMATSSLFKSVDVPGQYVGTPARMIKPQDKSEKLNIQ